MRLLPLGGGCAGHRLTGQSVPCPRRPFWLDRRRVPLYSRPVHRTIFALLGGLMVLATSMPAQAVPLLAPETDTSGPATVSAASANVAAPASSSAATVAPKERFFGAVQAIYNPDRAAEA